MITFLTSPKPFKGTVGHNQAEAIASWQAIDPETEVIVYGDVPGAQSICQRLGASHVPAIASSPSGVPYFNAIVDHASEHGRHDTQIYLNCDIILSSAIASAIGRIEFPSYLLIGQRIDLAENTYVDPQAPHFLDQLATLAETGAATLHSPGAMDYFAFRKGMWAGLKPLVIGRTGYDAGLVAHCLLNRIPVIDATLAVPALHLYHDYAHVQGGHGEISFGVEARQNRAQYGIEHDAPNSSDAGWMLTTHELRRIPCRGDRLRALQVRIRFTRRIELGPTWLALLGLSRLLEASRLYSRPVVTLADALSAYGQQTVSQAGGRRLR